MWAISLKRTLNLVTGASGYDHVHLTAYAYDKVLCECMLVDKAATQGRSNYASLRSHTSGGYTLRRSGD